MDSDWHLYLVRTRHDTIYTGIATDVERRLQEHASGGNGAARYLRGRGPLQLVYTVAVGDRSLALRLEHAIKQLPRHDKEALIASAPRRYELLQRFQLKE